MTDSIRSLPYVATDGKTYQRDFADDKGLFLIAQHLRVTKEREILKEIKQYLAKAGAFVDLVRREPETVVTSGALNPDQAIDAAIKGYRKQGKDDNWIAARIQGKIKREQFTAALKTAVLEMLRPQHYAIATNELYIGLWERTAAQLKQEMNLPKSANLRDHQPSLAPGYLLIAEDVCARKLGEETELTFEQAKNIVREVAELIGRQAAETGKHLGMDISPPVNLFSPASQMCTRKIRCQRSLISGMML